MAAYLREQCGADADLSRIDALIRQLGSADFAEREQASKALVAIGPAALPGLRVACNVSLPKMSSWQRSAWVNRSFLPARRMRGSCRPLPRRQHRYPRKIPQHYALRREKRGQGILLRPAAGRDTDSEVTGSD